MSGMGGATAMVVLRACKSLHLVTRKTEADWLRGFWRRQGQGMDWSGAEVAFPRSQERDRGHQDPYRLRSYPNKNSFDRNSLIESRSLAAFSNSNLRAASRISPSSLVMY